MHHHSAGHVANNTPATRGKLIRWAQHYDLFVDILLLGRRAQLRRTTIDLAQLRPGEAALEVGCGTGDVALEASRRLGAGAQVVGIDPAPEMIAVAREKAARAGLAADFQVGVIEALALPDATFDVVLSSLMMHHLPDNLKQQGLAEIARVLRPGGRLLIVDMKRVRSQRDRLSGGYMLHGDYALDVYALAPLLRAAGFEAIETGDTNIRMLGFIRGRKPLG